MPKEQKSEFRSFRKELLRELGKAGYQASEVFTLKKNGEKEGIIFQNKSTFSPVIYIRPLYEEYIKGNSMPAIVQRIADQLPTALAEERRLQEIPVLELMHSHEHIRRNLRICLLNRKTNKELLAVTPNKIYGDFAAVVYWILPDDSFRIMVRQELLEKMGVDFQVLFQDAYINMMDEFELKTMEEMLYESMEDQLKPEEMKEFPSGVWIKKMCQGKELYVMTHKSGMFGAAALCFPKELERAAEKTGGDFAVIPASVDELIFLPFRKDLPLEALNELVHRINESLEVEERLADMTYVYLEKERNLVNSYDYMENIRRQREQAEDTHQRGEHLAREEGRNR